MKFFGSALIAAVSGLLLTGSLAHLHAHHGATTWDSAKTVTVRGAVVEFAFLNPHVLISIDVKRDEGGTDTWRGELTNPISLARTVGWTSETFKAGDVITLVGTPAKNGAPLMAVTRVLSASSEQLYPLERQGLQ